MGCCVVDSGIAVLGTNEEEVKSLENSVVGRVEWLKVEPLVHSVGDKVIVAYSVESASVGGFEGRTVVEDGELGSVVCISETVVEKAFVYVTPELEGLKVDGIKPSVVGGASVEDENCGSVDTVDSEIGPKVVTVSVFKLLVLVVVKKSVDCSVPVNVVPSVTPWVAMDSVVGMKVGKGVED